MADEKENITTETTAVLPSYLRKAGKDPDALGLEKTIQEIRRIGPQPEETLAEKIQRRKAKEIRKKRGERLSRREVGIVRRGPSSNE